MSTFNLDAVLHPSSILLVGTAQDRLQQRLIDNVQASSDKGVAVTLAHTDEWPASDLAVVLEPAQASPECLRRFSEAGGKSILWAASGEIPPAVAQACREGHLRALGPRSCGIVGVGGINVSCLEAAPAPGGVALIAQSRSVAAAIADFACGRSIGVRWMAVTGSEQDIDVADLLDYAAVDPRVSAVILEVGLISQARKFMSAARAAARIKPVAVLQRVPGGADTDPVRSSAFMRAGLVECEGLEGAFDALAALDSLGRIEHPHFTVVGNGTGLCAVAATALTQCGIPPAILAEPARRAILDSYPGANLTAGVVDLGDASAANTVVALRALLAEPAHGLVLFMHGPGMQCPQDEMADAVARAGLGARLIAVWPGLARAAAARSISSSAGVTTFSNCEQAARAIRYRAMYDSNRTLLMETPLQYAESPDSKTHGAHILEKYCMASAGRLAESECCKLLEAYGIRVFTAPRGSFRPYRLSYSCHAEFGMHLSLFDENTGERLVTLLPPLDQAFVQRILGNTRVTKAHAAALAPTMVKAATMISEQAAIQSGEHLFQVRIDGGGTDVFPGSVIWAGAPVAERRRLAMAAYPARFRHTFVTPDGHSYHVRAIRPADEPALVRLFKRLDPDEVRYRFFSQLRHFSHEMAARMSQIDYDRELAMVAFAGFDEHEIVGTATLVADANNHEAEFAVLVQSANTGHGLGRHLMTCLLERAADNGIGKVWGEVLSDNRPMLQLARELGFRDAPDPLEPGCRRVEIEPGSRSWERQRSV